MVLPLLAAGIGAGGTIISGIMGANAANSANDTNWRINLLNYYQREREREDAKAAARENKREQQLGVTDGQGNRTRFVPGKGWVVELSDGSQRLLDLQEQEQLNVLQKDLPMKRRQMERNEKRSFEDESQADTLRRDLRQVRRTDDSELEALLYSAATNKMAQAFDESQAATVREAQRTGSSNIGKMLEGLNKNRAESYADAAMEAKLRARGSGDAEFEKKRSGLANLYNMFATRASVGPDVSYKPTNVESGVGAGGMVDDFSKLLAGANNTVTQTNAMKGGSMDYVQPNYGAANAVGSGSRALASMFRGLQGFGGEEGGTSSRDKYDDRLR